MKSTTTKALKAAGFKVYGSFVMIDDVLYPLPLVQGNDKLGRVVWHSSTAPTCETITATFNNVTVSEPGTCPTSCRGCYGTKGHFQHDNVKYYLIMRTKLLRNYPDIYFQLVRIQIENENIQKLRIHAVGDFIPGEAAGFMAVLKDYPHVKAWTYTKVENSDEIKALDMLPNCNVVKSIIPGCGFNFGHVAYIAAVYYRLKRAGESVYICRCGIDPDQHCSDCNGCSSHKYVLFLEHSTGYNAKTDYGYKKIIDLINGQPDNVNRA